MLRKTRCDLRRHDGLADSGSRCHDIHGTGSETANSLIQPEPWRRHKHLLSVKFRLKAWQNVADKTHPARRLPHRVINE